MQELLAGGENAVGFATSAVRFWERVVELLVVGFVVSYFWTAVTIVYFLLRKSVDAMPLDAVAQAESATDNDSPSLPLVGVAAAQQREQTDSGERGT